MFAFQSYLNDVSAESNMAILTIPEVLDAIIMSALIGYIFYRYFARFNVFRRHDHESFYQRVRFNWSDFMFSIYLIAPAILLHELGHKFAAMGFGYEAVFHSPISIQHILNPLLIFSSGNFFALLMVIAVVSTALGGTFLFFVPAYVSITPPIGGAIIPIIYSIIAFAGPAVNLVLWLGVGYFIKKGKIKHKYMPFAILTSKINMLLFIFNMLPIPGFDGWKVYDGLFSFIF